MQRTRQVNGGLWGKWHQKDDQLAAPAAFNVAFNMDFLIQEIEGKL